jgi:hypothetical protein
MGMARLSLDDGWRACGNAPAAPAAPLQQLLKRGQLLCVERDLVLAATPESTQVLVLSALAASEMWLDGVLIGSNGQPASRAADERRATSMWPSSRRRQLAAGTHQLRLRLSTQRVPALDTPCMRYWLQEQQATRQRRRGASCRRCCWPARWVPSPCSSGLTLLYRRRPHWAVFGAMSGRRPAAAGGSWRGIAGYAYPASARLYAVSASWLFAALLPLYFHAAYRYRRAWLAAALLLPGIATAGALATHFDSQCRLMFFAGLTASSGMNLAALRQRLPGSRSGGHRGGRVRPVRPGGQAICRGGVAVVVPAAAAPVRPAAGAAAARTGRRGARNTARKTSSCAKACNRIS